MFTVVRYSLIRPPSTTALIETTSAPVMPRTVFAASWTAASAALAKLSGDDPITVMTLAMSAIACSFRSVLPGDAQQLEDAALVGGRVFPQQLVELDPDEENDRRRVDVADQDEEDRQAADRGLEVRDVRDEQVEQERRADPGHDHEDRARARPLLRAALGRREAHEHGNRERQQRDRHEPAADRDDHARNAVLRHRRPDEDDEQRADEADGDRKREPE